MTRLLAVLLITLLAAPSGAQTLFDPLGAARIDEHPGARLPLDVPLRDARGRPTSLRRIAGGRPLLLVPVLHECPNFCGVTLAGLADAIMAQRLRPGRDFALVAFGIDPREGPREASDDLAKLRKRPSGRGLPVTATVGRETSIRAMTDALGYRYAWDARIGQYAHIAAIAVLTPEGRLSGWLYGLAPQPAAIPRAVLAAGREQPAPIGERIRLLCFHYDSTTGRYTLAVDRLLKGAALLTVLLMGATVLRLRKMHG